MSRDDLTEQVYQRAADSDLPDESFVMVSRAIRGKDPLTGDDPQPQPERYFVEPDGYGDVTLWRGAPDDPKPKAVAVKHTGRAEEWELILRGAGLDKETVCVSREDLAEVLWHSGLMPLHASHAAERLWNTRTDWPGILADCPNSSMTNSREGIT